jgi:hypothetical protein
MRAVCLALVCSSVFAGAAQAAPPPGWSPDLEAATRYALARPGSVSFAVRTPKRLWGHRMYTDVRSASVVKAMLLVAYLNHRAVKDRPLRDADRALLRPMIRVSDNIAATRVRDVVGNAALERLARRARMRRFRVDPWWGRSTINAAGQSRFFLRLPELTVRRHRAYALRELAAIVPEQRWGIGEVIPRGWTAHFKGGWGSGTGLVDHQVVLLRRGDQRVAIAVMTTDNPSHAAGKRTLRGVFRRLVRGLARVPVATPGPEAPPQPDQASRSSAWRTSIDACTVSTSRSSSAVTSMPCSSASCSAHSASASAIHSSSTCASGSAPRRSSTPAIVRPTASASWSP